MTKVKRTFKWITCFMTVLCVFAASMPCQAKEKSKKERSAAALQYIKKGTDPYAYIADKLRNYKVVAIGEDHWIADHSEFLCDVLRNVGYNYDDRIQFLALEFGNEYDQMIADSLALGKKWHEDFASKILLRAPDMFGNPYQGYRDVLYTVWETNQRKPDSLKTRIILLDPWDKPGTPEIRDENMAKILRSLIRSGGHTIFYAGQAHTQYQTRGVETRNRDYYYNFPSGAKYIKMCYPDDIFSINLWGGLMGSYGYLPNEKTVWTLIDGGVIDDAFAKNGNKPVGFDIDANFPITPSQYYAGEGSGNDPWAATSVNGDPYKATLKEVDYCDGIIFIKPIKEFTGMQLIDIYDDVWVATIADRLDPSPARTKEEIFKKILEWHPTCLPPKPK